MKYIYSILLLAICLCGFAQESTMDQKEATWSYWLEKIETPNVNFHHLVEEFDNFWEEKETSSNSVYKQFKRWQFLNEGNVRADGSIISDAETAEEIKKAKQRGKSSIPGTWTSIGPFNTPIHQFDFQTSGIGRLACVAFHPTDPQTLFVGAPTGGIWKSEDGGQSWHNLNTDSFSSLGVSSICVHPGNPNIIFIGTGDRDGSHSAGIGIYKTSNGGISWQKVSDEFDGQEIHKILIAPGYHNIMFAATTKGIYKSENTGNSWEKLEGLSRQVRDLVFKPGSISVLYAEAGGDFYKSENFGYNWDRISDGLEPGSRGAIAVSPDDPERVYFFQTRDKRFKALYVSDNSGTNFQKKESEAFDGQKQGSYNIEIAADPNDADVLFAGMIKVFKSNNAGNGWECIADEGKIHADQHAFEFSPHTDDLYVGNDGGLYSSSDGGENWENLNAGMIISQIHRFDVCASDPNHIIAGFMDCGSSVTYGGEWSHQYLGDGMDCLIDDKNPDIMYAGSQNGGFARTLTGAVPGENRFKHITSKTYNNINEKGRWVSPILIDQEDSDIVFIGLQNVWRTSNATTPDPHDIEWENITNGLLGTSKVKRIEQFEGDRNVLYIIGGDGRLYKTTNALDSSPTWTQLTNPENLGSTHRITPHPTNPNILYASHNQKMWKSTNGGGTWDSISAGLPKVAHHQILFHKGANEGLYVCTQKAGVYYKSADYDEWVLFKTGLPITVTTTDIDIYSGEGQDYLYASTFGRGLWKTEIDTDYRPNLKIVSGVANQSGNNLHLIATAYNDEPESVAGEFSVGFYVSKNAVISTNDYLIGEVQFESLHHGVFGPVEFDFNMADLPQEVEDGTWYAGAIIDYKDDIPEKNEEDNAFAFEGTLDLYSPNTAKNLNATDGEGYWVALTWEEPVDVIGPVYYRVYRNTVNNPETAVPVNASWQLYNASNDLTSEGGQEYFYWIRTSYNGNGYRPGNFSVPDQGWSKLEPPINVVATDGTYHDKVQITWEPQGVATHFRVYRSLVNDLETAQPLSSNWKLNNYFNDYNAVEGTDYYYWVRAAMSSTGYRSSAAYSEFTPGFRAWADAPDAFASDGTYDDRIRVNWNSIENATHYQVWRTLYDYSISALPETGWFSALEYDDFDVEPGDDYKYWVIAANNPSGDNPTGFGEGDAGWVRFSPPENLQASDGTTPYFIQLSWNDTPNAPYYKVYRSEFSGYGYAEEYSHWFYNNYFTDENTLPGQTWYYWVKCTNDTIKEFISDFSNEDSGWKGLQPSEVTATKGVFPWRVDVDWEAVEGGLVYRVSRAPVTNPLDKHIIMDWTTNPPFHLQPGFEGQYYENYFYVETARDLNLENPSVGVDVGFAGECGNLAGDPQNHEAQMNGTVLNINHRVINDGAYGISTNSIITYFLREYQGGDQDYPIGQRGLSGLDVDEYADLSYNFNLMDSEETIPIGQYIIVYQLDADDEVCENYEDDNLVEWLDAPIEYTNAMHGIYTIGGENPDFETINEAVSDLMIFGISDPVFFRIRPGEYLEQLTIHNIEGVSASKQITFMSDPYYSDTAVVAYFDEAENYIIRLNGANQFIFQNLKFVSEGYTNFQSTYGRVFSLSNSHYITIKDCRFIGSEEPDYISENTALIYSENSTVSNLHIYGNKFENGSYGIYLIGIGAGDDMNTGIEIRGNRFHDFAKTALLVYRSLVPKIDSNFISRSLAAEGTLIGVDVDQTEFGMEITKNRILLHAGIDDAIGISLKNSDNTFGESGIVANNFVAINTGGENNSTGILLEQSINVGVYYNSIHVYGTPVGFSTCIFMNCADAGVQFDNQMLNNIFSNTAEGYAIYYPESCYNNNFITMCDFNALWPVNTDVAWFNGADCHSLLQWQQLSGFDENSIIIDPEFYSETNLHLTGMSMVGKATQIEFIIDDDIDGDTRDVMSPDIGADEFVIPDVEYDLSISLWDIFIMPPADFTKGEEPISLTLTNEGLFPMSNTSVSYKVNNADWITESLPQTIEPWDFYDHTFSQMADFSVPGNYQIIAKLSNPLDQNPLNDFDTISFYVESQPYCDWLYMMGCDWMYNIETVKLGTINNEWSGCSDMGYGDFIYLSAELEQGETYPLTLQTAFDAMYVSVWIDFNNDHIFNESNEKLITDLFCENAWTDYSSNITVPIDVLPGDCRMRVRSVLGVSGFNACDEYEYGEAEDYTATVLSGGGLEVNIGSGKSNCAGSVISFTANASGGTPPYTFEWSTGHSSQTIEFLILADTTISVLVRDAVGYSAIAETAFSVSQPPDLLVFATEQVCEGDDIELFADAMISDSLELYCSASCELPDYCVSGGTQWGGPLVTSVVIGEVNNYTYGSCTGYSDFTNLVVTLAKGNVAWLEVSLGYCDMMMYEMGGKVFIDWNRDGDFEDMDEMVATLPSTWWEETYWIEISIPETAVLGTTKLRIVCKEGWDTEGIQPCGNFELGETEDYAVEIYEKVENYVASWYWIGPDGFSSSEQNPIIPNVDISNKGHYSCQVTDGNGCAAEKSVFVFVANQAMAYAGEDQTTCESSAAYCNGQMDHASWFEWSTMGTGTFDAPTSLNTNYFPGDEDVLNGEVELQLVAWPTMMCADPAISSLTISITEEPQAVVGTHFVCDDMPYIELLDVYAVNYSSLFWTSDGTGYFEDSEIINPTYHFGPDDEEDVNLFLSLEGIGYCINQDFEGLISIVKSPSLFAGSDKTVCDNSPVTLGGTAENSINFSWATGGDGFFSDPSSQLTSYQPGASDVSNGMVYLWVESGAMWPCTVFVRDTMQLTILGDVATINAGADEGICESNTQLEAISSPYNFIYWTTSGDGAFDNPEVSNPVYSAGETDLINGSVLLTVEMQAANPCTSFALDEIAISYIDGPQAFAGADTQVCGGENISLLGEATNYSNVEWETSGDGTFSSATTIASEYFPGNADIASGNLLITFMVFPISPCVNAVEDQMNIQILRCQNLMLNEGWSGISSWVNMQDVLVEELFTPALNDLIIIQNQNGMYWPAQNINSLGSWDNLSGYTIKMSGQSQVELINTDFASSNLQLSAGWNLMPVNSRCDVDVEELLSGTNLIVLKEAAGYGIFWPEFSINTIGNLIPGSAYFALLSSDQELVFPECENFKSSTHQSQEHINMIKIAPWSLTSPNVLSHTLAIPSKVINNANLQAGDWLGAFDQSGNCCGVLCWQEQNMSMMLFGDDQFTTNKDGFVEEELLTFKTFCVEGEYENDVTLSFDDSFPCYDVRFQTNGLSLVKSISANVSGENAMSLDEQIRMYPNPATNKIFIEAPDEVGVFVIEIFALDGVKHERLIVNSGKVEIDIHDFSPGVYSVKVSWSGGNVSRKVVKY